MSIGWIITLVDHLITLVGWIITLIVYANYPISHVMIEWYWFPISVIGSSSALMTNY